MYLNNRILPRIYFSKKSNSKIINYIILRNLKFLNKSRKNVIFNKLLNLSYFYLLCRFFNFKNIYSYKSLTFT